MLWFWAGGVRRVSVISTGESAGIIGEGDLPFHITILYAGLNGLLVFMLALRVTLVRGKTKIAFGMGGNAELELAARVHGNAIEYVPIVLILMGLLEAYRVPMLLIHGIGVALTLGRVVHAWGYARSSGPSVGRAGGTILTWLALLVASVTAILVSCGVVLV